MSSSTATDVITQGLDETAPIGMPPCTKLAIVATMLLCVATAFASPVVNNVDVGGRPSGNVDGRRAYTQQIISRTQPTGASGYMQCVATPAATHAIFQTCPCPPHVRALGKVLSWLREQHISEQVLHGASGPRRSHRRRSPRTHHPEFLLLLSMELATVQPVLMAVLPRTSVPRAVT